MPRLDGGVTGESKLAPASNNPRARKNPNACDSAMRRSWSWASIVRTWQPIPANSVRTAASSAENVPDGHTTTRSGRSPRAMDAGPNRGCVATHGVLSAASSACEG